MRKTLIFILFTSLLFLTTPVFTSAQENNSTASEEAIGKEILQKLQDKQLACQNLNSDDYEKLGEYFMGQMAGSSHEAMNQMMEQMMGKDGEEQMHIAMGKRLSGCEPNAQAPSSGVGFMPMMWTKGGGNPMMSYSWNNMMSSWNGFGLLGWIPMVLFWVILILGGVALVRYLGSSRKSGDKEKTPLDILKERYAKGEIDKKEFEEKKKDLN